MAALKRNEWQHSYGMGGNFEPEYAVGIVMGVLTYLMVISGLIVFAGSANMQTPELIWIIAFIGSFSDNFSINLLQKLLGQFKIKEESNENEDKKVNNSTAQ